MNDPTNLIILNGPVTHLFYATKSMYDGKLYVDILPKKSCVNRFKDGTTKK